jgi:hypothetical protein
MADGYEAAYRESIADLSGASSQTG